MIRIFYRGIQTWWMWKMEWFIFETKYRITRCWFGKHSNFNQNGECYICNHDISYYS